MYSSSNRIRRRSRDPKNGALMCAPVPVAISVGRNITNRPSALTSPSCTATPTCTESTLGPLVRQMPYGVADAGRPLRIVGAAERARPHQKPRGRRRFLPGVRARDSHPLPAGRIRLRQTPPPHPLSAEPSSGGHLWPRRASSAGAGTASSKRPEDSPAASAPISPLRRRPPSDHRRAAGAQRSRDYRAAARRRPRCFPLSATAGRRATGTPSPPSDRPVPPPATGRDSVAVGPRSSR